MLKFVLAIVAGVFAIFVVGALLARVLRGNDTKPEASEEEKVQSIIPPDTIESREMLLTEAEQAFYAALMQVVNNAYAVMAKVRLEDIIMVKKGTDKNVAFGLRNRIKSRHIDFVLCDHGTLAIRACIELDDRSHARAYRQKRDEMVEAVLKQAGVYLVRVPWSPAYEPSELRQKIFGQAAEQQQPHK